MRTLITLVVGAAVGAAIAYWLAADSYERRISTLETELAENRELVKSAKAMDRIADKIRIEQQAEEAIMSEEELRAQKEKLDRALKYFKLRRGNNHES